MGFLEATTGSVKLSAVPPKGRRATCSVLMKGRQMEVWVDNELREKYLIIMFFQGNNAISGQRLAQGLPTYLLLSGTFYTSEVFCKIK